nr:OadG family transporter subunit [Veillonella caviae]
MEGHVVTTSPWLVMAINMTVVFAVLIALGVLMKVIHWIDPTKKSLSPLLHLLLLPQHL